MSRSQDLKHIVRQKYPFPISHAYAYLESRADPDDRYQALLSCLEVTLKSIASIALANFMRDIQDDPELGNAHLFQDLLDIWDCLRACFKSLGSCSTLRGWTEKHIRVI